MAREALLLLLPCSLTGVCMMHGLEPCLLPQVMGLQSDCDCAADALEPRGFDPVRDAANPNLDTPSAGNHPWQPPGSARLVLKPHPRLQRSVTSTLSQRRTTSMLLLGLGCGQVQLAYPLLKTPYSNFSFV